MMRGEIPSATEVQAGPCRIGSDVLLLIHAADSNLVSNYFLPGDVAKVYACSHTAACTNSVHVCTIHIARMDLLLPVAVIKAPYDYATPPSQVEAVCACSSSLYESEPLTAAIG